MKPEIPSPVAPDAPSALERVPSRARVAAFELGAPGTLAPAAARALVERWLSDAELPLRARVAALHFFA